MEVLRTVFFKRCMSRSGGDFGCVFVYYVCGEICAVIERVSGVG